MEFPALLSAFMRQWNVNKGEAGTILGISTSSRKDYANGTTDAPQTVLYSIVAHMALSVSARNKIKRDRL